MIVAHLGVAVATIGVTLVSAYGIEKDVRMSPDQDFEMAGYTFQFQGVTEARGPNYQAQRGQIRVVRSDTEVATLYPEKRSYFAQTNPMTESAIDVGLTRDLYVSLGESLGDGAWSVRLYYKPFIRWIWLGGVLMGLGGILAVSDRRYRIRASRKSTPAVSVPSSDLANERAGS